MSVGAVALIANLIIQQVQRGRCLPWSLHRRIGVPFEAVLFPTIAFFFVAATMQLLLPVHDASDEIRPPASTNTLTPEQPGYAEHDSSPAVESIDPQRNVLITNVAMIAGAIAAYGVAKRCLASRSRGVIWLNRGSVAQVADGIVGALGAFALCFTVLQATVWILSRLNPDFAPVEHNAIEALQSPDRPVWLVPVVWIGTCIVAPIAEELFFRGLIQTTLLRAFRRRWIAIVLSASVFGAAHMSQPHVVPAIFMFGLILGVLYERRAALAGPIIAHALFNAKTMLWMTISSE